MKPNQKMLDAFRKNVSAPITSNPLLRRMGAKIIKHEHQKLKASGYVVY